MYKVCLKALTAPLTAGLLLTACSSDDDSLDLTTSWLGPLAQYQQVSGSEGFGIFVLKQGDGVLPVGSILLQPAEITVSNRSDLNAVTPKIYDHIRSGFADAVANRLAEQAGNVQGRKGTETYLLRVALTNVTVKRKDKSPGEPTLSRLRISFENASIEAELRAQRTNIRHAVIIATATAGETPSKDLGALFRRFAENFSTQLAAARTQLNSRGSQPKPQPKKP